MLNAIKAESQGVQELETVDSLNGVNSLPGVKGEKLVNVPMELLQKPATDAAAKAETAASNATSASRQAESSAMVAEGAAEEARKATAAAEEAAEKAEQAATSYESTAKAALKGATARFDGFVESGTTEMQSSTQTGGTIVYIKSLKLFAYSVGGKYYNSWSSAVAASPDLFLTDTRTAILKDKVYICGDTLYTWSEEEGDLAVVSGSGGSGSGFYNVTKEIPLPGGYYTKGTAVAALAGADIDDDDKQGMIITIEVSAGKWEEYRFEGTDTSSFLTASAWNRYGGADAIKKITVTRGTATEQHTADEQGGVTIDIPVMEVDQSVNENSTNAVSGKAVAAKINEESKNYVAGLRLNEIGEGTDKAYSFTMLDKDGEEMGTTDMFTGGGGGSVATTKVVLTRVTPNKTVKSGDEVKLTYTYDQTDTTTGESTGNPGRVTVTVTQGANSNSFTANISAGSTNTVDVTKYMGVGTNTVRVRVEVGDGAERPCAAMWTARTPRTGASPARRPTGLSA